MHSTINVLEGAQVLAEDGSVLGTVSGVLFHPSDPRVVGFEVAPRAIGGVVKARMRYVGLASAEPGPRSVTLRARRLPPASRAADELGHDPDLTVVYAGMDVAYRDGERIGQVADAVFETLDGSLLGLSVSAGMAADAAHGRMSVPADEVAGYREGAVRLTVVSDDINVEGGVAKQAGVAAAVTHRAVDEATDRLGDAAVVAGAATGRAIRKGLRTPTGKKVAKAWRGFTDAMKDGDEEG